jgi:hypothetical protein
VARLTFFAGRGIAAGRQITAVHSAGLEIVKIRIAGSAVTVVTDTSRRSQNSGMSSGMIIEGMMAGFALNVDQP